MVSAPVKSAPVNEPKNEGTPGAQVRMMAPKKSGTIIMPPGIRSIVRLMGTWTMAGLAGAWKAPTSSARHAAPRRATLQVDPTSRRTAARRENAQEQAVDLRDRLRDLGHRRRGGVLESGAGPPRREGHAGERRLSRAARAARGTDGAGAAGHAPEPDPSGHRERRPGSRGAQAGSSGREAHRVRGAVVGDGVAHWPTLLRGPPAARADWFRWKRMAVRRILMRQTLAQISAC